MKNFIKFEVGVLIGTVMGASIAALVCSICYGALGYQITDMTIVQDCLQQELNKKASK